MEALARFLARVYPAAERYTSWYFTTQKAPALEGMASRACLHAGCLLAWVDAIFLLEGLMLGMAMTTSVNIGAYRWQGRTADHCLASGGRLLGLCVWNPVTQVSMIILAAVYANRPPPQPLDNHNHNPCALPGESSSRGPCGPPLLADRAERVHGRLRTVPRAARRPVTVHQVARILPTASAAPPGQRWSLASPSVL